MFGAPPCRGNLLNPFKETYISWFLIIVILKLCRTLRAICAVKTIALPNSIGIQFMHIGMNKYLIFFFCHFFSLSSLLVMPDGSMYTAEHEMSLQMEGLTKPRRKRGRPPKIHTDIDLMVCNNKF